MLSCSRKFQLRVAQGLTPPRGDAASHGDTVHKALEYLDKGESPDTMLEHLHAQGLSSIPKALSLVTFYKGSVNLPPPIKLADGMPGVEIKFSHKYSSFMIPNSHELLDVYLDGTIDRIHIDNDTLVVLDYKTFAGGTKYLIDKELSTYSLAFQPVLYLYALKYFGIIPASYLDYITAHKYRIEIHLLCHNTAPPTFKKHVRHAFNDDFLDREVPLIINSKISEALAIASLSSAAPHTGMTVYKACQFCEFRPACLVMGEAREDEILSRFEVKPYNPMTFR